MSDKPTHPDLPPEEYLTWEENCVTYTIAPGVLCGDLFYRHGALDCKASMQKLSNRELAAFITDACRRWTDDWKKEMHKEHYPGRPYHPVEGAVATAFGSARIEKHKRKGLGEEWQQWGDENG